MVEPSGHCPYLGLKQNQAIRFASPTPEHRCYAAGQAQEIPQFESDYQARYCLSANHVRCPLYMGMPVPTTSASPPALTSAPAVAAPTSELRSWLDDLSARDRFIYSSLLGVLVIALIGYALGGVAFVGSLLNSAPAAPTLPIIDATGTVTFASPTASVPAATATPTASATPAPSPTVMPSPTATPYELIPVTNTPTVPIVIPPPVFPPPVEPTFTPLPPVEPTVTPLPPVEPTPPPEEPTPPPEEPPTVAPEVTPTVAPEEPPTVPPEEPPTVPPEEPPTVPPEEPPTVPPEEPPTVPPEEPPTVPPEESPTVPPEEPPTAEPTVENVIESTPTPAP